MLAPSFPLAAESHLSHRLSAMPPAALPRSLAVAGAIFVDGHPAAGAVVSLHPVGPLRFAYQAPRTFVAADGSFELSRRDATDVARGDYALTCEWRGDATAANRSSNSGASLLPVRLARPDATPLRVRLTDKPIRLEPIHIDCNGQLRFDNARAPLADAAQ